MDPRKWKCAGIVIIAQTHSNIILVCSPLNRDLSESLVDDPNKNSDDATNESKKVTGVVTNQDYGSNATDEESPAETAAVTESTSTTDNAKPVSVTWKLNLVLSVICCFYAMSLTGWGSINSGGNAANPSAGSVGMWMIIASQWLVMALYLWTLVAPRLFPDREFSWCNDIYRWFYLARRYYVLGSLLVRNVEICAWVTVATGVMWSI